MKFSWTKSVLPIAAIFSFRMLGLFMLIPVFTVYANSLQGATPALIGLTLGGYGLTQGLLQIPFGMLSDRWGRKPVLTIGLLLFALGSFFGAISHSIYGMLAARIIQGTGAIGSVLIALLADLTPEAQRTKGMAVIGMTIGLSFGLAMVLSPFISRHFGLSGIFYSTMLLAFLGLVLLHTVIPESDHKTIYQNREARGALFKEIIKNKHLQRLNFGIFCQHFILTATFFEIPMLLQEYSHRGYLGQSWHFYLPIMFFSFAMMIPLIALAEKRQQMKALFLSCVGAMGIIQLVLAIHNGHWWDFCLLMLFYFAAFNCLEASLPSLISKQAPPNAKGTAMGIYSSCQFLGIFVGGSLAGFFYQWAGGQGIFFGNAVLALVWFSTVFFMKTQNASSQCISLAE